MADAAILVVGRVHLPLDLFNCIADNAWSPPKKNKKGIKNNVASSIFHYFFCAWGTKNKELTKRN